jgi:DNA-directed RNA polymerase specialized sigma24 family protein
MPPFTLAGVDLGRPRRTRSAADSALSKLSPAQRDVVVMRVLESDADLAAVLPAMRATIAAVRRIRLPLRRGGVA